MALLRAAPGLLGRLVALAALAFQAGANAPTAWPVFHGAWFSVHYPPGFRARPSMRSSSGGSADYDSVFFSSPDGTVEFYVFSPQWNGQARDVQPTSREVIISQRTQTVGDRVARHVTVKARDGSYERSILDIEDGALNTRLVFGLKYRNREALEKHRAAYLRFRNSVTQYAD